MIDILPLQVQWRQDKANLSANFVYGLMTLDQNLLEEAISIHSGQIAPYVDLEHLQKAYTQLVSQKAENKEILELWAAALLAKWLSHAPFNAKYEMY